MNKSLKRDTPFDQYSRQYQVAALLNDLRKKQQTFKILDVGGHKGKTAEFFPQDEVWVLDVFDVKEPNYIKGDGTGLPFSDNDFDFVVNFDVLEHIPAPKRNRFIDECNRAARVATLISAPQKTPENQLAEEVLNNLYKEFHRKDHQWLKEHIDYGLPSFKKIREYLEANNYYTVELPSNDTTLWVLMQGAIFLNSKFAMGAPKLIELNEYYNTHFPYDGGVDADNTYRIILCVSKNSKVIAKLSKHFMQKNRPLDLRQKIKLIEKIQQYYGVVITKMSEHSDNLKQLHEHEAKRAAKLYDNNLKLHQRIAELEKEKKESIILHKPWKKQSDSSSTKSDTK